MSESIRVKAKCVVCTTGGEAAEERRQLLPICAAELQHRRTLLAAVFVELLHGAPAEHEDVPLNELAELASDGAVALALNS